MIRMILSWISAPRRSCRKRRALKQLCVAAGMEQLECRALTTALFNVPAIVGPVATTNHDASETELEVNFSHRQSAGAQERRRSRSDTIEIGAVITSDSGVLNGRLGLAIGRSGRTTGIFSTSGAFGIFQVSGWTVDGPVVTFHGANHGREYPIPVQGYNRLDTLVQMTIDKSSGVIQGTLQATLYGRRVHPLAITPIVFTGNVVAAQ